MVAPEAVREGVAQRGPHCPSCSYPAPAEPGRELVFLCSLQKTTTTHHIHAEPESVVAVVVGGDGGGRRKRRKASLPMLEEMNLNKWPTCAPCPESGHVGGDRWCETRRAPAIIKTRVSSVNVPLVSFSLFSELLIPHRESDVLDTDNHTPAMYDDEAPSSSQIVPDDEADAQRAAMKDDDEKVRKFESQVSGSFEYDHKLFLIHSLPPSDTKRTVNIS